MQRVCGVGDVRLENTADGFKVFDSFINGWGPEIGGSALKLNADYSAAFVRVGRIDGNPAVTVFETRAGRQLCGSIVCNVPYADIRFSCSGNIAWICDGRGGLDGWGRVVMVNVKNGRALSTFYRKKTFCFDYRENIVAIAQTRNNSAYYALFNLDQMALVAVIPGTKAVVCGSAPLMLVGDGFEDSCEPPLVYLSNPVLIDVTTGSQIGPRLVGYVPDAFSCVFGADGTRVFLQHDNHVISYSTVTGTRIQSVPVLSGSPIFLPAENVKETL